MNFSEQNAQSTLPQFSEISARTGVTSAGYTSTGSDPLISSQSTVYTTTVDSVNAKQILINAPNKYQNSILNWADPNALMQLCEKQGLQTLNIPGYSQNSAVLGIQPHNLPMKIVQNVYIPQDANIDKNDGNHLKNGNDEANSNLMNPQTIQQSLAMAEYLQKLQSTSLPLSIQQIIKYQSEHVKKEKDDDQKNDQIQNSILNIPSVPIYKNVQIQNDGQYMNSDHMILTLNPSDVNVHMESHEQNENHNGTQHQTQTQNDNVEQRAQTKSEKKIKFRAKTGEIKLVVSLDGSTIYHCPECTAAFAHKSEIEEHLQVHILERKYECKECGAMLKRKEHLDQHMRGHSNERPFKCTVCHKAFKRNEHLTRHFVIHSGDKNFTCPICHKAFSRKDHLNKHTQTHLGSKKSKPKKEITELALMTASPGSDSMSMTTASANATTAIATSMLLRPDLNSLFKDGSNKQETTTHQFLQHIQSLQKDSTNSLMQSFREHMLKDGTALQHQAVNMNDILPQSTTRYLMQS